MEANMSEEHLTDNVNSEVSLESFDDARMREIAMENDIPLEEIVADVPLGETTEVIETQETLNNEEDSSNSEQDTDSPESPVLEESQTDEPKGFKKQLKRNKVEV